MAEITTQKRNALPAGKFALPETRKYPIDTAARVRNAAARLEQAKTAGNVSSADYSKARKAIGAAAKKFGIESEYSKPPAKKAAARGLSVRAHIAPGGELHVRHMSDRVHGEGQALPGDLVATLRAAFDASAKAGDDVALRAHAEQLLATAKAPVWIQLAKPGKFEGHPAGPFELNDQVFREIVANFNATQNRAIPVDFEHATEQDPTSGSIPVAGAPAQGWIRDLKIEGGNLYGLVEWGDLAREYIREGKYKFFSPAIRFNSKDRVTGRPVGARMTSGAMTNSPYLDGLAPLAAKDNDGASTSMAAAKTFAYSAHEYMPRIKAALKLPELATAQMAAAHLDMLRDHFNSAGGDHTAVVDGVHLADYMHPLRELASGGMMGTTWEQVFDVVEDMIDAAMDRHIIQDHGGVEESEPVENEGDAEMTDDESGGASAMTDNPAGVDPTAPPGEDTMDPKLLKDLETKTATLELQLKDEQAKRTASDALVTSKDAEIKALKDAAAKRDDDDRKARVVEAFDTYKDAKKLSDTDRDAMLLVLSSNPELFEKLYPKVNASERHLSRNLTGGAPARIAPKTGDGPVISMRDLAKRIAREKGVSLGQAQVLAEEIINRRKAG